ncbi:pyrimidine reductase family protein [Streptomyces malaysiensis subsp. malaysiensis]|uniref:Pyrimidine reductase family protein n=1 Tax=Streptomyces malaysiensis TaxID=92644 RepID=A0ABX6WCI8_STRMQ|nr:MULTISPECIES: pyrimidine reductase family protein [Streptomyces]QPI59159.1 pyrimidine reductase family protein [Streptomyces solisilvae]UHH20804.1 pyrimidine reductase family protein [Streptomyces sp. HNM0561]
MRRLFPVPAETSAETSAEVSAAASARAFAEDREWGLGELADAYAYPEPPHGPSGAWLRANMVSSLDGAAHHDGRSKALSSDADMRIFGVLRGLADAVVVGAETVRREGYRPARAREAFAERRAALGQPPAPAIAVVSASLDLDFSRPLFTEPLVPTIVITGATAAEERVGRARAAGAEVVFAGSGPSGRVDAAAVVTALAELGHTRLLTEGGPTLLAEFAAAGVLDELCLAVAPLATAGDAKRIMNGPELREPERFALASVLEEAGFLFTRYRRIYQ